MPRDAEDEPKRRRDRPLERKERVRGAPGEECPRALAAKSSAREPSRRPHRAKAKAQHEEWAPRQSERREEVAIEVVGPRHERLEQRAVRPRVALVVARRDGRVKGRPAERGSPPAERVR